MAIGALLTACDPKEDDYSNNALPIADTELAAVVTFVQSDESGNPQADGNYFTFTTKPSTVVDIYALRADGSENLLSHGTASGTFKYAPSRGSDSQQTLYVRTMKGDGTLVTAEKAVTVFVPGELEPAVKLLASDAHGSKTWKWDTSAVDGCVWGNMGYCGGSGADVALASNGKWWGVTSEEEFLTQLNHTEDGAYHGDGSLDATMVMSDDGLSTTYDAQGNIIRQSAFKVENYDPNGEWRKGILKTTAILWPYQINAHDNDPENIIPGEYEIVYLTADKLCLVYPDKGDYASLGSWGEATFWHFTSNTDLTGMTAGYEGSKDWTWNYDGEHEVWGNMCYCGGAGSDVGLNWNGKWWGIVNEEDFAGQLQHSHDHKLHGDESKEAYMTLGADGTIVRHAADGSVINSGIWEMTPVKDNPWKVADLKTTAGTILWPYQINWETNGFDPMPTTFEVVYLTPDRMTLVYPDGGAFDSLGAWGEATFWHFKAK